MQSNLCFLNHVNVKGKVVPVRTKKVYRGSGGTAAVIHDLDAGLGVIDQLHTSVAVPQEKKAGTH